MKTFIGITQDLEETAEKMTGDCEGMHIGSEFGPFKSSEDAERWMEYIMQRSAKVAPASVQPMITTGNAWYGFTLEADKNE